MAAFYRGSGGRANALACAPMSLLAMLLLSQSVQVNIPLPVIRFEAPPPLVLVTPGIQVVPEHEEEIFFVDGFYWHRRDNHWFKSKDHHGNWVVVEERGVPPGLVKLKVGEYRHFKREEREEKREEREEKREEKREKHEKKHK